MTKQLGVSNTHDDPEEGSESGVPSTDQTSEGRKKALDQMFDSMVPIQSSSSSKSKKKKRGDDDDDGSSDDDKPKRRRGESNANSKLSPEAGVMWFCLLHASSTQLFIQFLKAIAEKKTKQDCDKAIRALVPHIRIFACYPTPISIRPRIKSLAVKARDTSNQIRKFAGNEVDTWDVLLDG